MRSKEEAHDYRYFPEPDLVPVAPTDALRAHVRATMPELPAARRTRLVEAWDLSGHEVQVLLSVDGLAEYAEAAAVALRSGTPRDVVRWATGDLLGELNDSGLSVEVLPLAPDGLAELVDLVAERTLSRNQARDVLGESVRDGRRPREIVAERGLEQVSDEAALVAVVDEVLASHADVVAELRAGDDATRKKKRGFLMGEAMKALRGQGNPQLLSRLLDERLG
jgi:aspartyl-tRNA(Asn)/glutamyl-tRNA(Gln) amidotransferase subunit B